MVNAGDANQQFLQMQQAAFLQQHQQQQQLHQRIASANAAAAAMNAASGNPYLSVSPCWCAISLKLWARLLS